jgi:hypothetical protein
MQRHSDAAAVSLVQEALSDRPGRALQHSHLVGR